jgi:hypothetical protein
MKGASWHLYCQQSLEGVENPSHEPLAYGSIAYVEDGFIPDVALTVGQENHDRRSIMHVSVSCQCYRLFCSKPFSTPV